MTDETEEPERKRKSGARVMKRLRRLNARDVFVLGCCTGYLIVHSYEGVDMSWPQFGLLALIDVFTLWNLLDSQRDGK